MRTPDTELYDELLGTRETRAPSTEYDPNDPLGLNSGRMSCTMRPVPDPLSEDMALVYVQDSEGNWVEDGKSRERRDMLMRSYRQLL